VHGALFAGRIKSCNLMVKCSASENVLEIVERVFHGLNGRTF